MFRRIPIKRIIKKKKQLVEQEESFESWPLSGQDIHSSEATSWNRAREPHMMDVVIFTRSRMRAKHP